MKRSIFLFIIIAIVGIAVSGSFKEAEGANQPTCCQIFKVIDSNGNPVGGCKLTVGPPCNSTLCICTTGATGTCRICGLTPGAAYTVAADCGGVSVNFTACLSAVVIIRVP